MKHGKSIHELAAEIIRQHKNKRDFLIPTNLVEAYAMNGELNLDFSTTNKTEVDLTAVLLKLRTIS